MTTNLCSSFSVDTIRFLIPLSDTSSFLSSFTVAKTFQKYDLEGQCVYDVSRFRLVSSESMERSKSYCSDVLFIPTQEGLLFEFSIPKFLYGQNVFNYWGLSFLSDFRSFLSALGCVNLPSCSSWLLKRIDISYSFVLPDWRNVCDTLSFLKDFQYRGKKCCRKDKEYPYWVFRNRTLKFYDKGLEMRAHKNNFRCSQNYFDYAHSVLRFEEEWRTKYLLRLLGKKRVCELTVKNFLEYMKYNYSFERHISSIVGDLSKSVQYKKIEDLYNCLEISFGRKYADYIKIFNQVLTFGVDYLKDNYPKSTYHRYLKKFRDKGIDLVHFSNFLNEESSPAPFLPENFFTLSYLVNDSNYVAPLQDFIENVYTIDNNKIVVRRCKRESN